jgi:hypothetical protein
MASPNSVRKKQTTPNDRSDGGAKATRRPRVDKCVAPERGAYNSPDAAMTYARGRVFPFNRRSRRSAKISDPSD